MARRYSEEELRELFANSDSEDSETEVGGEASSSDNSDLEVSGNQPDLTKEQDSDLFDASPEFRPISFGKGIARGAGVRTGCSTRVGRGRGRGGDGASKDEKWDEVRPGNLSSQWLPAYDCESPGKPVHDTSSYVPLDFFLSVFPEMKAFLGLLILMGLDRSSSYRTHWNTDPLLDRPGFRVVMSRNRFMMILRFFHVSDNSLQPNMGEPAHDRSYKIRGILENLISAWNESFYMEKEVSVDECMVAFKGRVSFLQYMKSKPTKWGMKGWVLAGSKTGYVYNWKLYTGKESVEASKNLGYRVVADLTADLKEGHIVFADNFFTSVELFLHLQDRGIGACGTVRCNRAGNPLYHVLNSITV